MEFYLNSVNDKKIIEFLVSILKKAGYNIHNYKDKRFNCLRLRVVNKEFFGLFDKDINRLNLKKEEILGFISGVIDAEGYVNKEKNFIEVVNTNFKLIKLLNKELNSLGINSSIRRKSISIKDRLPSYNLFISVNFKRLKHLSIKAGKLS